MTDISNHAEDVLLSLLDDVDSVEVWAKEGVPTEVIPTEEIRPVVDWVVDYYFRSGRMKAPSKEAIRATWGQVLDDAEVTLGDGTETDDIDWAIDNLREAYVELKAQQFNKAFAVSVFEAAPTEKVQAVHDAAYELTTLALSMMSKQDATDILQGAEDALRDYHARVEAGHTIAGLITGLPEVDEHFGGVRDGEVCTFAAPPKTGKSYGLNRFAYENARIGRTAVLFTLENSVSMTLDRIACMALGIDPGRWMRGECNEAEIGRVHIWINEYLPSLPGALHVIRPEPGKTTMQGMVRQAEMLGCNALFIDQLTFVENPGGERKSRNENIREMMHDLKTLVSTGRHKIPVMIAHQINREGVKMARKLGYLEMDHLAEGSEVERTSDFVLSLYQSMENRAINMALLQTLAARRSDTKAWNLNWAISTGQISVLGETNPYAD